MLGTWGASLFSYIFSHIKFAFTYFNLDSAFCNINKFLKQIRRWTTLRILGKRSVFENTISAILALISAIIKDRQSNRVQH